MKGYDFSFIPRSIPGAKNPPQLDKVCYGVDLRTTPSIDEINAKGIDFSYIIDAYNNLNLGIDEINAKGIDFSYIIDAYNNLNLGDHFFRSFFELETGQAYVRQMIKEGKSADQIKAMWQEDVAKFKEQRKPYLLYPEN